MRCLLLASALILFAFLEISLGQPLTPGPSPQGGEGSKKPPRAAESKKKVDGNRLTYLDDPANPYYVHRDFPKLTTPMWVGEEGVEAVVILGIDDMRGHEKWEAYLRPILNRLKKIDGRAPVSIMTCSIKPDEPHLQTWLKEGLSLECHTIDHPCPLLKDGDFAKAKSTYDRCVDLMFSIPNNRPVAFRTPCCDSLNTNSPRMYAEVFAKTTSSLRDDAKQGGNFLHIDTSVFHLFSANDPALPRELVLDADGRERFRKYVPYDRSFVNLIEDYPYPYVIGRTCWEFPCVTPSDWQAQHLHKPNNPLTVRDWQAALDCTVIKQGVFCLVFHPHGWIKPEQVIELIDHAQMKHGKKVKFLTFKEALERLNKNVLGGNPIRNEFGDDAGVRLVDVNNDGFLDVLTVVAGRKQTRVWLRNETWHTCETPFQTVEWPMSSIGVPPFDHGLRFGAMRPDRHATVLLPQAWRFHAWHFDGKVWAKDGDLRKGLDEIDIAERRLDKEKQKQDPLLFPYHLDYGYRLRDLNRDGCCELIVDNEALKALYFWSAEKQHWVKLPFVLPKPAHLLTKDQLDAGLRFIDLNEDGYDDIVFSNEERYGIWLFESMEKGWSKCLVSAERKASGGHKPPGESSTQRQQNEPGGSRPPLANAIELPPITINGANNGFFVHSRHLWWQNEHTNLLKDHMDRRSFAELLKDVQPGPKSPEQSLKCTECRPGFTVELVAAEPLVEDPIAFAWGADGKLWVVEMGDYPLGVPAGSTPSPPAPLPRSGGEGRKTGGGRVRCLEDTDGDGKYDKSTIFLDGLPFPTGVMPWRKGVLVTCAPDIFYAEDTDGDGKADKRVVLFTGFKEGNQQHRVNGLVWGLDGWVYGANGDSGGVIRRAGSVSDRSENQNPPVANASGSQTGVNISGRDFRFKPDTGEFEAVTGQSQYGRCRDDWGNWFGGNNANPLWHFVLEDRYLKRNPHFAPPNPRVDVPVTPGQSPVHPISRTLPRFNDFHTANRFTSACSPTIYRDDLFGPHFENNVFICEPVHNLVSRLVLTPEGVTFKGRRAPGEEQAEFVASTDNWFRPVFARTGPDGALWIADMYRHVIEHPEWIPKETQKTLDLRAGHDKGRIYRVYPIDKKPRAIPRLDKLDTAGLVAALDSPNGWQRDMAQMMLVWKNDKAAVRALVELVAKAERPAARLQALSTLDALGDLTNTVLLQALSDSHPAVRRNAIRICESPDGVHSALADRLDALVKDPDAQVRMQLAYTLGRWHAVQASEALGQLAVQSAGDRYLIAAVMSSLNARNIDAALEAVLASGRREPAGAAVQNLLPDLLRMAHAFGSKSATAKALAAVVKSEDGRYAPWQFAALTNLLDALEQRKSSLEELTKSDAPELKQSLAGLEALFATARAEARRSAGAACDLNRASAEELQRLPGIGPRLAERLVAERQNAAFKSVEDLRRVPGLGEKAIQKLRPFAVVDPPADAATQRLAIGLLGRDPQEVHGDTGLLARLLAPQSADDVQLTAIAALGRLRDPLVPELLVASWKSCSPGLRARILDVLLQRPEGTAAVLAGLEKSDIRPIDIPAAHRQRLLEHKDAEVHTRAAKLFAGTIDKDRQKVIDAYKSALTAKGDAAKGQPLFVKNCSACHKLAGVGTEIGPELAALKDKSPAALLEAILDPNRAVEARYVSYVASTQNGLTLTGLLHTETSNSITLIGTDGKPQTILRTNLERLASTGKSAMPEGMEKDIDSEQMADLLAFLTTSLPQPKRKEFVGNQPELVKPDANGVLKLSAENAEIYGAGLVFEAQFSNLGWWSKEEDHAMWTIDVPKPGKYSILMNYACQDSAAGNSFDLRIGETSLTHLVVGTGAWENYKQIELGKLDIPAGRHRVVMRSAGPIKSALLDLRSLRLTPSP